jgi:hypothetical protein
VSRADLIDEAIQFGFICVLSGAEEVDQRVDSKADQLQICLN